MPHLYVYALAIAFAPFVLLVAAHAARGLGNLASMFPRQILFAMSVAAVVNLGHAPLPGASTFPLRARGPDKILHLRGWLEENGGNASGLTVAAHGGLLSTAVFDKGGVVAGVPLRMVMDDRTAVSELPNLFGEAAARSLAVEYAHDPSLLLSLYLMAQRGMGGGSAWRHYGDILPQGRRRGSSDPLSGFDNIPAFFNRSMLGLLRGSALGSEAELQRRMLEHKWGRFCRSSAHASLCQEFDHTEFFWASTVVATRAFDLRGLLDHAVKAARGEAVEGVEARGATGSRWTGLVSVRLAGAFALREMRFCSFAANADRCSHLLPSLLPPLFLSQVPLVDMANHDIAPNCGYRMDISACSRDDMASAERSAGCAVFQLVAKRRISSGEAVTVSYGSLDNFRSMVSYGFAQAKRNLGSFAFQFPDAPFSLALVQLGEYDDESGDGRIHGRMRWSADKEELLLDISSDGGRGGSNRKLFDDVAGDIFYRLKKSYFWFGGGVGQGGALAELHSLDMMLYALTHFNSAGDDQEELSGSRRNALLPSSPYLAEAAIPLRCDEVFGGSECIVGGLKPSMAVPIVCLPNCAPGDEDYIVVWGDGRYSASSRICAAAQHHTGSNGGTFLVKRHDKPAEVGVLGVFANGVSSGNVTLNDPADFSIERLGDKEAGSSRHSTAPFAHFGARALRRAKATVLRLLRR
jgi:hypothetical protein